MVFVKKKGEVHAFGVTLTEECVCFMYIFITAIPPVLPAESVPFYAYYGCNVEDEKRDISVSWEQSKWDFKNALGQLGLFFLKTIKRRYVRVTPIWTRFIG